MEASWKAGAGLRSEVSPGYQESRFGSGLGWRKAKVTRDQESRTGLEGELRNVKVTEGGGGGRRGVSRVKG